VNGVAPNSPTAKNEEKSILERINPTVGLSNACYDADVEVGFLEGFFAGFFRYLEACFSINHVGKYWHEHEHTLRSVGGGCLTKKPSWPDTTSIIRGPGKALLLSSIISLHSIKVIPPQIVSVGNCPGSCLSKAQDR